MRKAAHDYRGGDVGTDHRLIGAEGYEEQKGAEQKVQRRADPEENDHRRRQADGGKRNHAGHFREQNPVLKVNVAPDQRDWKDEESARHGATKVGDALQEVRKCRNAAGKGNHTKGNEPALGQNKIDPQPIQDRCKPPERIATALQVPKHMLVLNQMVRVGRIVVAQQHGHKCRKHNNGREKKQDDEAASGRVLAFPVEEIDISRHVGYLPRTILAMDFTASRRAVPTGMMGSMIRRAGLLLALAPSIIWVSEWRPPLPEPASMPSSFS